MFVAVLLVLRSTSVSLQYFSPKKGSLSVVIHGCQDVLKYVVLKCCFYVTD